MTEFMELLRRAQKAQQGAAELSNAKPGSLEYEARQKLLAAVDQAVVEILHDHLDIVSVKLDRSQNWNDRWAVLLIVSGQVQLKIPVKKLIELDRETAKKVEKKMTKVLQTLEVALREAGKIGPGEHLTTGTWEDRQYGITRYYLALGDPMPIEMRAVAVIPDSDFIRCWDERELEAVVRSIALAVEHGATPVNLHDLLQIGKHLAASLEYEAKMAEFEQLLELAKRIYAALPDYMRSREVGPNVRLEQWPADYYDVAARLGHLWVIFDTLKMREAHLAAWREAVAARDVHSQISVARAHQLGKTIPAWLGPQKGIDGFPLFIQVILFQAGKHEAEGSGQWNQEEYERIVALLRDRGVDETLIHNMTRR